MADMWLAMLEWEALFSVKNSRKANTIRGEMWCNWIFINTQNAKNNLNLEL